MSGLRVPLIPQKKGEPLSGSEQVKGLSKVGKNNPVAAKFAQVWNQVNHALAAKLSLKKPNQKANFDSTSNLPNVLSPAPSSPKPTSLEKPPTRGDLREQKLSPTPPHPPISRHHMGEPIRVHQKTDTTEGSVTTPTVIPMAVPEKKEASHTATPEVRDPTRLNRPFKSPRTSYLLDSPKSPSRIAPPPPTSSHVQPKTQPLSPTFSSNPIPRSKDTLSEQTAILQKPEHTISKETVAVTKEPVTVSEEPVKKSTKIEKEEGVSPNHEPTTFVAPLALPSAPPIILLNTREQSQTLSSSKVRPASPYQAKARNIEPTSALPQTTSFQPAARKLENVNSPETTHPPLDVERTVSNTNGLPPKVTPLPKVDRALHPIIPVPEEIQPASTPEPIQSFPNFQAVPVPDEDFADTPALSHSELHIVYIEADPTEIKPPKAPIVSLHNPPMVEPSPPSPMPFPNRVPIHSEPLAASQATLNSALDNPLPPRSRVPLQGPREQRPNVSSTSDSPPLDIHTTPPRSIPEESTPSIQTSSITHSKKDSIEPLVPKSVEEMPMDHIQSKPFTIQHSNHTPATSQTTSVIEKSLPITVPIQVVSSAEDLIKKQLPTRPSEKANSSARVPPISQTPLDPLPVRVDLSSKEGLESHKKSIEPSKSNRSVPPRTQKHHLEQNDANTSQPSENVRIQTNLQGTREQPHKIDVPVQTAVTTPVIKENVPFVSATEKPVAIAPSPQPTNAQELPIRVDPIAKPETTPPVVSAPQVPLPQAERSPSIQTISVADTSTPHSPPITDFLHEIIHDPGVTVSIQPNTAHMAITSTEGDLSLHVRVRDGQASIHVAGSMAPLFESRGPEMRQVLASEGLQLGNFVTTDGGQGQGSHHPPSHEPASIQSLSNSLPVKHVTTKMEQLSHESGHIHITA